MRKSTFPDGTVIQWRLKHERGVRVDGKWVITGPDGEDYSHLYYTDEAVAEILSKDYADVISYPTPN